MINRSDPDSQFWEMAVSLLARPGVTRSTMMGYPCLRLHGDFFASWDQLVHQLVVKLDHHRVEALIENGDGLPFAPAGRRFREWLAVPATRPQRWPLLLEDAYNHAIERLGKARGATMAGMSANDLERVREIALSLPGVAERRSHGAECFFVRGRRPICYFHDHHNDDRVSLWCPASPGVQEALVAAEPERFFKPPASARGIFSTWVGVFLDGSGETLVVDWEEIAEIIEDAFRLVAPSSDIAELDRR